MTVVKTEQKAGDVGKEQRTALDGGPKSEGHQAAAVHRLVEQLELVKGVRKGLEERGVAIILGAPGSGKSEQLELALSGRKAVTFDVRTEFSKHYASQHPGTDAKKVKKDHMKNPALKNSENEWLNSSKEAIRSRLLGSTSPGDVIIFDEFDLALKETLNAVEQASAGLVLDLAKSMAEEGRQVVLVIHSKGYRTPEFMEALAARGLLGKPSELVRTNYLDSETEGMMLDLCLRERETKEAFMALTSGLPAAYLGLLEHLAAGGTENFDYVRSHAELTGEALANVKKNYKVARLTCGPDVVKLLNGLANGAKTAEDKEVQAEAERLLDTGLVGSKDGKLIISGIVRRAINEACRDEAYERLTDVVAAASTKSREQIRAALEALLSPLEDIREGTGFHSGETVFEHTMNVLAEVERNFAGREDKGTYLLAAVLHDIGKPKTLKETGDFPGHADDSILLLPQAYEALGLQSRSEVETLVRLHMEGLKVFILQNRGELTADQIADFARKLEGTSVSLRDMLMFCKSDTITARGPKNAGIDYGALLAKILERAAAGA